MDLGQRQILLKKTKEETMKKEQEEKKSIPWEVADPKPPVIRSGHMENRRTGDAAAAATKLARWASEDAAQ